jgi:hypothetical protein
MPSPNTTPPSFISDEIARAASSSIRPSVNEALAELSLDLAYRHGVYLHGASKSIQGSEPMPDSAAGCTAARQADLVVDGVHEAIQLGRAVLDVGEAFAGGLELT